MLAVLARGLLDGAGALFGLYLLIVVGLAVAGRVMRARARGGDGRATGEAATIVLPVDGLPVSEGR